MKLEPEKLMECLKVFDKEIEEEIMNKYAKKIRYKTIFKERRIKESYKIYEMVGHLSYNKKNYILDLKEETSWMYSQSIDINTIGTINHIKKGILIKIHGTLNKKIKLN